MLAVISQTLGRVAGHVQGYQTGYNNARDGVNTYNHSGYNWWDCDLNYNGGYQSGYFEGYCAGRDFYLSQLQGALNANAINFTVQQAEAPPPYQLTQPAFSQGNANTAVNTPPIVFNLQNSPDSSGANNVNSNTYFVPAQGQFQQQVQFQQQGQIQQPAAYFNQNLATSLPNLAYVQTQVEAAANASPSQIPLVGSPAPAAPSVTSPAPDQALLSVNPSKGCASLSPNVCAPTQTEKAGDSARPSQNAGAGVPEKHQPVAGDDRDGSPGEKNHHDDGSRERPSTGQEEPSKKDLETVPLDAQAHTPHEIEKQFVKLSLQAQSESEHQGPPASTPPERFKLEVLRQPQESPAPAPCAKPSEASVDYSTTIIIKNGYNTGKITRISYGLVKGSWAPPPRASIGKAESDEFTLRQDKRAGFSEGKVEYRLPGSGGQMQIHFKCTQTCSEITLTPDTCANFLNISTNEEAPLKCTIQIFDDD